mgnify:CR=1 FL=1
MQSMDTVLQVIYYTHQNPHKRKVSMYTIYTTETCGYCYAAKKLLTANDIEYKEIDLNTTEKKNFFKHETGLKTVPQIYTDNGDHIGGYDDLVEHMNSTK